VGVGPIAILLSNFQKPPGDPCLHHLKSTFAPSRCPPFPRTHCVDSDPCSHAFPVSLPGMGWWRLSVFQDLRHGGTAHALLPELVMGVRFFSGSHLLIVACVASRRSSPPDGVGLPRGPVLPRCWVIRVMASRRYWFPRVAGFPGVKCRQRLHVLPDAPETASAPFWARLPHPYAMALIKVFFAATGFRGFLPIFWHGFCLLFAPCLYVFYMLFVSMFLGYNPAHGAVVPRLTERSKP